MAWRLQLDDGATSSMRLYGTQLPTSFRTSSPSLHVRMRAVTPHFAAQLVFSRGTQAPCAVSAT